MSKKALNNLVKVGQLKAEPATRAECDGMVDSAKNVLPMLGRKTLPLKADLIWPTARHMALHSPPCGRRGIAQETDTSHFRRLPIRWRV
jgi:hypothetical protein